MNWPPEIEHVSWTMLRMLSRCPEQFRRRYILGEKRPPSAAAIWGSADHAGIAHAISERISTGEYAPLDETLDAARDKWIEQVDAAGGASEIDWGQEGKDKDPSSVSDELRDRMLSLVEIYRTEIVPEIAEPIAVESEFTVHIGAPVPLRGVIDVVTEKGLIERKTASAKPGRRSGEYAKQARVYQLAYDLPARVDVSVKTKTPSVYPAAYVLDPSAQALSATALSLRMAALRIAELYSVYGPDNPWPDAVDHEWACSWCGYADTCPWLSIL